MKKLIIALLSICLIAASLAGCSSIGGEEQSFNAPAVKCHNGTFVGTEENGIASFKGIPYAKAPVGELRWKAPQAAPESDETFYATEFGKSALQPPAQSEPVSLHPENMSEDCLTLNIWTTGNTEKKKPVMFWIHGGAYAYSGSSEALYNGAHILERNPDVVVVTVNYRLGLMGFADLSNVPGGEEFPTSGYNGILDQIEALKWVRQNIEGFGGDPENVTVFGESAGGGSVCCLLVAEGTEGLFQHVIAQSGAVNFTYAKKSGEMPKSAKLLLKKANAASMDDLMKLSEKEIFDIYLDENGGESLSHLFYAPMRGEGSIIPEDPYQALLDGAGKDIDLMIGTTSEEYRYFIYDVCNPSTTDEKSEISEENKKMFTDIALNHSLPTLFETCSEEEMANINEFFKMHADEEELWQKTDLLTEISFRAPAIRVAENHAKAGGKGKTYMYMFCKKNTSYDWIGASHSCELPYVFHNFEKEQESVSGPVITELADKVNDAWVSFAAEGSPDCGTVWPEYSPDVRETLFFNDDGTISVENDPFAKARELISPLLHYYIGL